MRKDMLCLPEFSIPRICRFLACQLCKLHEFEPVGKNRFVKKIEKGLYTPRARLSECSKIWVFTHFHWKSSYFESMKKTFILPPKKKKQFPVWAVHTLQTAKLSKYSNFQFLCQVCKLNHFHFFAKNCFGDKIIWRKLIFQKTALTVLINLYSESCAHYCPEL